MSASKVLNFYRRKRKRFFGLYMAAWILFSLMSVADYIPDTISVTVGGAVSFGTFLPVTKTVKYADETVESFDSLGAAQNGICEMECRLLGLIPVKSVTVNIVEDTEVIPCGVPVGIYIQTEGVYVVDITKVETGDGTVQSPAKHLLKAGDYITAVNGESISTKEELVDLVRTSEGQELLVTVDRGGVAAECAVTPVKNEEGVYQLGIWVRDDMAGIGTLTYVTEDQTFGALGHSISDVDTSDRVTIAEGTVYHASVLNIIRGEKGSPGELVGQIRYADDQILGTITENQSDGIFGILDFLPEELAGVEPVSVGYKQKIREGEAEILMEFDGEVSAYTIQIESVNMNASEINKSLLFYVTDEELIEKTGGIIQGMSGCPILQDGKIIGAVTHVFVSDPRQGYGIFIEDMLSQ